MQETTQETTQDFMKRIDFINTKHSCNPIKILFKIILYKLIEELQLFNIYYSTNSDKLSLWIKIYNECCDKMDENIFYEPTEDEINAMYHYNIYNNFVINLTKLMNSLLVEMSKLIRESLIQFENSLFLDRFPEHMPLIRTIMNSLINLINLNSKMIIFQFIRDKYPEIFQIYIYNYNEINKKIPELDIIIKNNIEKCLIIDNIFNLSLKGFHKKTIQQCAMMREYFMKICYNYDIELITLKRKRISNQRNQDITTKLNEGYKNSNKDEERIKRINEILNQTK